MKAILLAGVSMIWQIWNGVQEMRTNQSNQALVQSQQAAKLEKLEANQEALRRDYVSRVEILEMMKRIEMQFTINRLERGKQ